MDEKSLGEKYLCHQCGCKFYDLKNPQPVCPKCGANQNKEPQEKRTLKKEKDIKYLMGE